MIESIHALNFAGVPHLETSRFMLSHPEGITFSKVRPNVIIGPNGAGKSSLLTTMSLLTLTYTLGISHPDRIYLDFNPTSRDPQLWSQRKKYHEWLFMDGLTVKTDNAPAMYFRPYHIPGNEKNPTHALFSGYSSQARSYVHLTRHKSSGQQLQALLGRIVAVLKGEESVPPHNIHTWVREKERLEKEGGRELWRDDFARLKVIVDRFGSAPADALPLVMLDEPDQSHDAIATRSLWQAIESADTSRMQIIVATHSLYPIMHPDKFHIIEAVPGYASEVIKAFGL